MTQEHLLWGFPLEIDILYRSVKLIKIRDITDVVPVKVGVFKDRLFVATDEPIHVGLIRSADRMNGGHNMVLTGTYIP